MTFAITSHKTCLFYIKVLHIHNLTLIYASTTSFLPDFILKMLFHNKNHAIIKLAYQFARVLKSLNKDHALWVWSLKKHKMGWDIKSEEIFTSLLLRHSLKSSMKYLTNMHPTRNSLLKR